MNIGSIARRLCVLRVRKRLNTEFTETLRALCIRTRGNGGRGEHRPGCSSTAQSSRVEGHRTSTAVARRLTHPVESPKMAEKPFGWTTGLWAETENHPRRAASTPL